MARKIKTPLFLNDVEVRDIESLRENFNVVALADYAFDGSLIKFLRERYYEDEAEKVENLKRNDQKLEDKLYEIFGVEKPEDPEITAWRNERLAKLKTFINDENILAKVDSVAFNQEDLGDLLDEGVDEIYLCNNNFRIPLKVTDKKYIGIGNAVAVIKSDKAVDFNALNISFENIKFDDAYNKLRIREKIQPPRHKEKIIVSGNSAVATTRIQNKNGVHARPASIFVQTASRYKSRIQIFAEGKTIDAKSILMIMSMGLKYNTGIKISAIGPDAEDAVRNLLNLVENKFYEE